MALEKAVGMPYQRYLELKLWKPMRTPNSAKVLVDLEARYALSKSVRLALGAENLFDTYPDKLPASLNTTGNTPYSNLAPFGRSGRYIYVRGSYSF
jgi:iron complex outermembrane receptor protein